MVLAALPLPGCGAAPKSTRPAEAPPARPRQMLATAPNGETIVMEIAEDPRDRARGLMQRSEVPRGTGMYFRFPEADRHSFWMFNCLTALDIAWLDANGVVVHVGENLPPCAREPCPNYAPDSPAIQVIEVAGGEARRMGIVRGARVLLQLDPGPPR